MAMLVITRGYVNLPEGKHPFSYGFPIKTSIFLLYVPQLSQESAELLLSRSWQTGNPLIRRLQPHGCNEKGSDGKTQTGDFWV